MPQRRCEGLAGAVLCAPDSFKGTISAADVAAAMARGIDALRGEHPARLMHADECPIGDGGEGTLAALASALRLQLRSASVIGPLGSMVMARYGVARERRLAVVELAQASGLTLLPPSQRDPMRTTTFGTGQLIRRALDDDGCREIIVCIGGSATVDGGCGIAQALGARFFDHTGCEITQPICGGLLSRIARIDREPLRRAALLPIACDVTNPLLGPNGAAAIYGPQKGASPDMVRELEASLANLARVCGVDASIPGSGASGGAGYGLMAMCGATLERGIDLVLDAVRFADRCRDVSLVLTGEGRLDAQSLQGKTCIGVARAAAAVGVPAVAIVGRTGAGWQHCVGSIERGLLADVISLSDRFGEDRAMREPAVLIAQAAREIVQSRLVEKPP
jgi:glycerate kinase